MTGPPLPLALAGTAVLTQVAYPLLDGDALAVATALSVTLFCAATLTHVAATAGREAALVVAGLVGSLGLAAEAVGVATGVPFGQYAYAGTLGPEVLGVPLLVPVAWTMMAWPALVAARTVVGPRAAGWAVVPVAAWLLASWDLFLDPQMVAAGHWAWAFPEPSLPGVPGIPLTNYAGWLLVSAVIMSALHVAVPPRGRGPRDPSVPALLLGWTWLGSTLANVAFFDRPAVAAYGFLAMGVVVGPFLRRLHRQRRSATVPAHAA